MTSPRTLAELVTTRAEQYGARTAYTFLHDGEDHKETLDYRALHDRSVALGAVIAARTKPGDRALLLLPPGIDFIIGFYACTYAGVIAVPTAPPTSADPRDRSVARMLRMVQDCDAALMLTVKEFGALLGPDATALGFPEWLPVDDEYPVTPLSKLPSVDTDAIAMLQYTSGSTASPRGVMLSHRNLLDNLAFQRHGMQMGPETEAVMWVPPYHDMGLIGGILLSTYAEYHVTLLNTWHFLSRPARWLEQISRNRATHTAGPNFALDLCVRKTTPAQRAELDLSSLRMLLLGAEPVRASSLSRFAAAFAVAGFSPTAFTPAYGLAEATVMVTTTQIGRAPRQLHLSAAALRDNAVEPLEPGTDGTQTIVSCGAAAPNSTIVVDPATGTALADGSIGELWTSGDNVSSGYWRQPESTAAVFGHRLSDQADDRHYLRTGDLGFQLDGELYVTGRQKDLIIVRGQNYYPQDLEQTVEGVSPLLRPGCGAAFAHTTGDNAEHLVLVHEVAAEANLDEAAGADLANSIATAVQTEHGIAPQRVVLVGARSIPKTTSGKIQRQLTKRLLTKDELPVEVDWARAAAAPIQSTVETSPLAWLATAASRLTEGRHTEDSIRLDAPASQLGLDSLNVAELVQQVETQFTIALPTAELSTEMTLRQLADHVAAARTGTSPKPLVPTQRTASPAVRPRTRFAELPEFTEIQQRLATFAHAGLPNPFFTVHKRRQAGVTEIDGTEYIDFTSYNYLDLSGHPAVSQAAKQAIDVYGTSVGASRLVSGERDIHQELEREIARFLGVADSIVYVSGNLTNVTTLGTLAGPGDLIVHDALAHDSLVRGAIQSGATRRTFPHNDAAALDTMLTAVRDQYQRVFIVVEGVYSMDGDVADLPHILDVKDRHDAYLMVDEAHSLGVLGANGRGVSEHFGIHPGRVEIWMGTLSKTLASCGGYIAGDRALIQYLKYTASGFLFSVGSSPADTAAGLDALKVLAATPSRVDQLRENSDKFRELASAAGFDIGLSADSAVVPIHVGDSLTALQISARLREHGVNVAPIVHPAVEEGKARLRFFLSAAHTDAQLRATVAALSSVFAKTG